MHLQAMDSVNVYLIITKLRLSNVLCVQVDREVGG